jgi:hypothetical protein
MADPPLLRRIGRLPRDKALTSPASSAPVAAAHDGGVLHQSPRTSCRRRGKCAHADFWLAVGPLGERNDDALRDAGPHVPEAARRARGQVRNACTRSAGASSCSRAAHLRREERGGADPPAPEDEPVRPSTPDDLTRPWRAPAVPPDPRLRPPRAGRGRRAARGRSPGRRPRRGRDAVAGAGGGGGGERGVVAGGGVVLLPGRRGWRRPVRRPVAAPDARARGSDREEPGGRRGPCPGAHSRPRLPRCPRRLQRGLRGMDGDYMQYVTERRPFAAAVDCPGLRPARRAALLLPAEPRPSSPATPSGT